MAPTVCSEKKVRVAGMKESRRRSGMGVSQSNTNSAGATQNSTVLSFVAKGSMNPASRQQRRRIVRLPSRLQQIPKSMVSTSSESEGIQGDSMETDEDTNGDYNEISLQMSRTHSNSSSSNSNSIKAVLQPTTANSNSNNSNSMQLLVGNSNNKTSTTAKLCDQMPSADDNVNNIDDEEDDDDEEEDQGDGDSGYEFALEPIKQPSYCHQQYHTNNEGLLSIALKTIKLVQRNKLLQKRLAQLQLETSEFIASVLSNPENRHFRDKSTVKTDTPIKVSNVLLRH